MVYLVVGSVSGVIVGIFFFLYDRINWTLYKRGRCRVRLVELFFPATFVSLLARLVGIPQAKALTFEEIFALAFVFAFFAANGRRGMHIIRDVRDWIRERKKI